MNIFIETKYRQITDWIRNHPEDGHPHYWCAGRGSEPVECEDCNIDHPMTKAYLEMLEEERKVLGEVLKK